MCVGGGGGGGGGRGREAGLRKYETSWEELRPTFV